MRLTSRRLLLPALALVPWSELRRPASAATRVKGAAELDAEFYLRGLLGQPSAPAVEAAPVAKARRLDPAFVDRSLYAVETTLAASLSMTPGELRTLAASRRRGLLLEYNKVLSSGAFGTDGYGYADVGENPGGSDSNQYSFDIALLSYFTCLANARLSPQESEDARLRLGAALLLALPVPSLPSAAARAQLGDVPRCSELVRGMRGILASLRDAGYIASFSIEDSDVDDALWQQSSALSATRLTISLRESASLRSAIVLNGRATSPELARPLLTAWLAKQGVTVVQASELFVDSTYRPNPLEYRPDEQVLELTIEPRAGGAAAPRQTQTRSP
jgi:hypothetical protein